MADDTQRSLSIKNLENLKLRQRIKELEAEAVQKESKYLQELETTTENLKREHEIEIKSKIRQFHQNNYKLMEEIVDARKSQCRAEEELVVLSEKNCQLIYDLKNIQQGYEKCKIEIGEISIETLKKDQALQKISEDLQQYKQKNIKLQEEISSLSNFCDKAKGEIRKKDSQILQLTTHMEDSSKYASQQEVLEKTIRKLQAKNSTLQLEIQETDSNRTYEILLKNKELLAGMRKLKTENEKLTNEKTNLEKQLKKNKINIEEIKLALETARGEISRMTEKNLKLNSEHQDTNLVVLEKEELLKQKLDLEKENQIRKKELENYKMEVDKNNQNIVTLVNEKCELKQRIYDLEEGNLKKLQIIAKLKDGFDSSTCNA